MRSGAFYTAVVALGACLLLAGAARAETAEDECQRLSDEAVEAYKATDYQKAVDLLSRAYAIRPLAPLLYNLAKAYDKLADADHAFETYKRYVDSGESTPELEAKAKKRMAFFEPQRKPKKPVEPEKPAAAEQPAATVTPAGPSPEELARAQDDKKRTLRLVVLLGGAVLAAAGAALIGVGGYEYGQATTFHDMFSASTDQAVKSQAKANGLSAGSLSTSLYVSGGVVLGVGAAAIVAALVLPQLKPGATEQPADKVSFAPWIGASGAGAAASWRF